MNKLKKMSVSVLLIAGMSMVVSFTTLADQMPLQPEKTPSLVQEETASDSIPEERNADTEKQTESQNEKTDSENTASNEPLGETQEDIRKKAFDILALAEENFSKWDGCAVSTVGSGKTVSSINNTVLGNTKSVTEIKVAQKNGVGHYSRSDFIDYSDHTAQYGLYFNGEQTAEQNSKGEWSLIDDHGCDFYDWYSEWIHAPFLAYVGVCDADIQQTSSVSVTEQDGKYILEFILDPAQFPGYIFEESLPSVRFVISEDYQVEEMEYAIEFGFQYVNRIEYATSLSKATFREITNPDELVVPDILK